MLSAILVGTGVAVLVIAAAAWPVAVALKTLGTTIDELRTERTAFRQTLVTDRAAHLLRIRELEAQVDSLHRQGLPVTSDPVDEEPPPPIPPLPRAAERWLEGVEDPEAREEMRYELRQRIAADPDRPLEDVLESLTTL